MADPFPPQGPDGPFGGFDASRVRVVTVGRRMHEGWRRIDRGGPLKRFLAGLLVIVLAIPILLLVAFLVLLMAAIGLASALVTFMLGGGPNRPKGPSPPDDAGRENVRVIPPRS